MYELASCNPWEWFVTLTLDPAKYDRYSLDVWRRDLTQWVRNQRRLRGCELRYLLLPERHADGAWHIHGLMAGIPAGDLQGFGSGTPLRLREGGYLDWPRYRAKFGFCSLGRLRDPMAAAGYVTKYVTKAADRMVDALGAHWYYASRGLAGALDMGERRVDLAGTLPDYAGDWCLTWWFDDPPPEVPRPLWYSDVEPRWWWMPPRPVIVPAAHWGRLAPDYEQLSLWADGGNGNGW